MSTSTNLHVHEVVDVIGIEGILASPVTPIPRTGHLNQFDSSLRERQLIPPSVINLLNAEIHVLRVKLAYCTTSFTKDHK